MRLFHDANGATKRRNERTGSIERDCLANYRVVGDGNGRRREENAIRKLRGIFGKRQEEDARPVIFSNSRDRSRTECI